MLEPECLFHGIVFASYFDTGIIKQVKGDIFKDKKDTKEKKMKKYKFPFVPPILLTGVLLILLPIFTFMTLDRLDRQKEFFTQRLLEKGTSLIRTFEAGTRTGMFTFRWGAKRIQDMLFETSLQPDVIYMMIISKQGRILAHSDASMVGQYFDDMPGDLTENKDPFHLYHRVRQQKGGPQVFEVYKRFVPFRNKFQGRFMGMHRMQMHGIEDLPGRQTAKKEGRDWCQPYLQGQDKTLPQRAEHYIFAGLSMERVRIARVRLLKETVWRGVAFFLLGCAGMIALFAFQAYRSARASLTRVKAFSDNVIQNMPAGLVTINSDHEVTSMNKAAKDILGGDLIKPLQPLIELTRDMKTPRKILNREINLAIDPDHRVLLDITASPIRDSDNQVKGFLFLFRDLTQIRKLKKQVETNKRLAAIGKLAAGVAHEIRNPLSSIKGFATYFSKRYEDNAADKETAQIMVREVERINRSITQLLEFAKPMGIEKKQVDIHKMIAHSLKLVHHDLEQKKIKATVDIDTEKSVIHTDGDRMNQVLLNLYINAIEALKENGILQILVQDAVDGDRIEIRIQDNGAGIDPDFLDQIFDPYFTTRSNGTGLGLSIVHRIIENLEGRIRVESKKGKGTCFIIDLPVS
jgi:two-component system sensor histidine kinase HydH